MRRSKNFFLKKKRKTYLYPSNTRCCQEREADETLSLIEGVRVENVLTPPWEKGQTISITNTYSITQQFYPRYLPRRNKDVTKRGLPQEATITQLNLKTISCIKIARHKNIGSTVTFMKFQTWKNDYQVFKLEQKVGPRRSVQASLGRNMGELPG